MSAVVMGPGSRALCALGRGYGIVISHARGYNAGIDAEFDWEGLSLAEDQKINKPTDSGGSKPLAEVKITGVNVDLSGIEKLKGVFNNLIKAISRGIGSYYGPIGRVRDAKADRAVANERAGTIIDMTRKAAELAALQKQLGIDPELLKHSQAGRAVSFLLEDAVRKQDNREKTIEAVAVELENSPPERDTAAPIDDDWLNQFWNLAENISREEVRSFLARVLCKEVSQPSSVSPLTLRVLSTITPDVAQIFERFCRLSIREGDDVFVIHPNVFSFQNIGPLDDFEISHDDLYELESYGLLRSAETIMLNFAKDQSPAVIDYAGIPGTLNFSGLQLHQLRFTRAGVELRELLSLSPIPLYTEALRQKLKSAFSLSGES